MVSTLSLFHQKDNLKLRQRIPTSAGRLIVDPAGGDSGRGQHRSIRHHL